MQAEDIVALLIPLTWLAMLAIGSLRHWPRPAGHALLAHARAGLLHPAGHAERVPRNGCSRCWRRTTCSTVAAWARWAACCWLPGAGVGDRAAAPGLPPVRLALALRTSCTTRRSG